ncbi:MAG: hypothetical protein JWQ38_2541 [Flavipsychrobacter sp.]|nr:hypothetical protein [Flavipsychrobacter sp.]
MKNILKFYFLFLLLGWGSSYAQKQGQAKIDSLFKEFPKAKEDTNKVKILNDLSYTYGSINPDEGIKYGQQALTLATKLEWNKGAAYSCNVIGYIFSKKNDYNKAIEYKSNALKISEKIDDKSGCIQALVDIGNYNDRLGNYPNALKNYIQALKIAKETNDKMGEAKATSSLGRMYDAQSDYPRALDYYFRALKIDEEIGNKMGSGVVLGNIGSIYSEQSDYPKSMEYLQKSLKIFEELGDDEYVLTAKVTIASIASKQGNYPMALEYYFNALKGVEKTGDKYMMGIVMGNIGVAYSKQGDYTKAIVYYAKSLKISEEIGDKSGIAFQLSDLGNAYFESVAQSIEKNNYKEKIPISEMVKLHKAIDYMEKSIALGKEVNVPDVIQYTLKNLVGAYKLSGDYKKALDASDKYNAIKDSVFSNDNKVKMAKLETKREVDLKEKQIAINKLELVRKQNERIIFSIGLGLMLVVVSGLFFNLNFVRKSRKAIQKEKDVSEGLLLNILPSEVAHELKAKGYSDAKHFDQATVLFTDFKGFTNMSEKMSADELVAELNYCFKRFDEITYGYGIEKIKTIGDSYMAAGGLPDPSSCTPDQVVKAALEMNDFILKRKAERDKEGKLSFEMRVGIHTGPVVAGIVGIKKFQYDIWGDTVNTASRMESSGEVGRVNISGPTYELVKDKFKCDYRGKITAKGKGEVDMYFVS